MTSAPPGLRGSLVPLVTPFTEGALDPGAFEAAVERVGAASDGIVVTGTSGEPTSLSSAERADLFRRAVTVAAGRFPVVAATGSPAFVQPSQEGLRAHFVSVATTTDLPFLIYNIPGRAGVGVSAETVQRVAESAPNLVGLKHASNDLDLLTELILALGEDFRLFCGLESYSYPFLALGGAGLMSAVGNLAPSAVVDLCGAVRDGDHPRALALHRALFRINQAIFFDTNPGPLKAMLAASGLGSEEVRPPLAPLSVDTRERVLEVLRTSEPLETGVA
jgi:4-hydroxy-tetrahydrodipicolinate synthase